ncbi:Mechanosensitive channel MscK precursor [compost metagenome]
MENGVWRWMGVLLGALWSVLAWAQLPAGEGQPAGAAPPAVELKIANRSIMVFRGTVLGETPVQRSARADAVISGALEEAAELQVRIDPIQDSYLVLLGDRRAFIVTPKDLGPADDSVQQAAEDAAARLRQVVAENHETRSPRILIMAAGIAAAATLVYIALVRLAFFARRKLLNLVPRAMRKHTSTLKIGHTPLVDSSNLYPLISRLLGLVCWTVVVLLSYEWLSFVLRRFPYTRPWGESLNNYLLDLGRYLLDGIVGAIPGLIIALAIFLLARAFSGFVRRMLERLARPGNISWLNQETLQTTTRLTSLAIWLFALAMAYPYLPGAQTEAFKGLSVLLGLMISLGASSMVGQAAAGLILTYTRTLRPGEFVRVGEHEGTVTELGMFTTTIRTGLGEVLTIPNSTITGTVTKNYSRTVQGAGYVVDTTVTIGYDTPWRQVEAMLLEAAARTPGILQKPAPQVFQTALSDFYPEYRLVAQAIPSEPRPRAELLSMLHANVQDVFNEHGVQIMSPHYLGDPEEEKWVPKERWFTSPAREPERGEDDR